MQFDKLLFSVLALAAIAVSATPSSSKVAKPALPGVTGIQISSPETDVAEACPNWCPRACAGLGYACYLCSAGYVFYIVACASQRQLTFLY